MSGVRIDERERRNVLGKAENWRTGIFLQQAKLCQEYFRTCGKYFRRFADLRLVFACVHAPFRWGLGLSTTASVFLPTRPQLWGPIFTRSCSVSPEIQSGSFSVLLFCAPMINSFSQNRSLADAHSRRSLDAPLRIHSVRI